MTEHEKLAKVAEILKRQFTHLSVLDTIKLAGQIVEALKE